MSLESTSTIAGLNANNPTVSDPVSAAPNHIWLLKSVLKAVFPGSAGAGFSKAITAHEDDLNALHGLAGKTSDFPTLLQEILDRLDEGEDTLSRIYPVGCVYLAVVSTNPATLLGFGTWAAFGAGKMLVGYNSGDSLFNAAEKTGGSKDAINVAHTHTLSVNSGGAHTHTTSAGNTKSVASGSNSTVPQVATVNTGSSGSHTHTGSAASSGSDGTNANLPPFITVYMWKRTA